MQTKQNKRSFFRSIRFQFIFFLGSLLLILLVLLNTFPLVSTRYAIFREKESSMTAQASTLCSAFSGLDFDDAESVGEVLSFLDIRGYDRILVSSGEKIIYDSQKKADDSAVLDMIAKAGRGKLIFDSTLTDLGFVSQCAMPIGNQGVITGVIYLHETDADRAAIISELRSQIRSVSILIAVAALLLSAVYSYLVLQRVHNLANSMRIVAEGDYSHRLVTYGSDELTDLGEEFNSLVERVEDTERQRRRFVSDASHELKTPLASIRLLSDSIIQTDNMDESLVREFVTDIGNEAQRLQRTTEKLLDLSRLDDDIQIMREPVDLKLVAEDVLSSLRPVAAEKNVTIHAELQEGCVVMATVDDMFHIIFNLTENAIKYNLEGGSVTVSSACTDNEVSISVADTGIGIPENETYNIFSRFYRIDKARSRETGGSGLGLSIVHDAAKAHGGTISVGANKPQGSIFAVRFPKPTSEETGI